MEEQQRPPVSHLGNVEFGIVRLDRQMLRGVTLYRFPVFEVFPCSALTDSIAAAAAVATAGAEQGRR